MNKVRQSSLVIGDQELGLNVYLYLYAVSDDFGQRWYRLRVSHDRLNLSIHGDSWIGSDTTRVY